MVIKKVSQSSLTILIKSSRDDLRFYSNLCGSRPNTFHVFAKLFGFLFLPSDVTFFASTRYESLVRILANMIS